MIFLFEIHHKHVVLSNEWCLGVLIIECALLLSSQGNNKSITFIAFIIQLYKSLPFLSFTIFGREIIYGESRGRDQNFPRVMVFS